MLRVNFQHSYRGGHRVEASLESDCRITAIAGPSGVGKTTVLNIVAGLLQPRQGLVELDGQTLLDTGRNICIPPEHRGTGFVMQESLLFPHLTIRANLAYGMARRPVHRLPIDRVAQLLELEHLLERYPATLSGGQARRVAIGRALLRGPRLLLLDEPWTGLDDDIADRVTDLLMRLTEEWSIPILLVSHDTDRVSRIAGKTIAMAAPK